MRPSGNDSHNLSGRSCRFLPRHVFIEGFAQIVDRQSTGHTCVEWLSLRPNFCRAFLKQLGWVYLFIMKLFFCFVILITLVSSAAPQDIKKCLTTPSLASPQEIEIHCSCMEQLIEFDDPIYMLTVNQTDCRSNLLRLNWNKLQKYTTIKKVVFDHASIIFVGYEEERTKNSVIEVEFYNSVLRKIPGTAFSGLHLVEVFRFFGSKIGSIESNAFSGLQHLKTIEFANTEILHVKEDVFRDLPNLEELAFIRSNLSVVETDAIHLDEDFSATEEECPPGGISGKSLSSGFMDMVTGRSLRHSENVTFPQYGRKLIFHNCDVGLLKERSINTNAFAYIIFGGNQINKLENRAFEVEFKSECEITAFLLIRNKLNIIKSEPFLGIVSQQVETKKAFFALIENTFYRVNRKGFSISPNLELSFIAGNQFSCSCENFPWIFSNEESAVQNLFDKKLLETGTCIGNFSLPEFLIGCDDLSPITPGTTTPSLSSTTTSTEFHSMGTTDRITGGQDDTISSAKSAYHGYNIIIIPLFVILISRFGNRDGTIP